ncbi:hypothetical protein CK203_063043 [Vitis vinifera]|uniref:Uncharacterized protein n=1 Tax=Vitis vinifera TaxID=29760 RepID=A0A438G5K3_VITVI|nr:hypothetical protein CK203_063043 [Vitis vinifera]
MELDKHMILIRGNGLCILELVSNRSRRLLRTTEFQRSSLRNVEQMPCLGSNSRGNCFKVGLLKQFLFTSHLVSPKACGHTRGRKVVSREEAVMRIKAAIDARKETGSDIVIVARTDSRQAVSFDESLWRSRALLMLEQMSFSLMHFLQEKR